MKCRICGSNTREILDEQFNNRYAYCSHCEFIGLYLEDLISFQEEREEYDRHENTIENEGYVNFFKKFLDNSVVPYVTGDYGLDFGSGPEPVLTQVIDRDYTYTMDHYDLHYQPERVYEGKTYDFIVSTEVFEHLQDPMAILKILDQHLKISGTISLMTLFHDNNDENFLQWWYRRDITHIGFFTPRTFEIMGELVGYKVIYTDDKRYITLEKCK